MIIYADSDNAPSASTKDRPISGLAPEKLFKDAGNRSPSSFFGGEKIAVCSDAADDTKQDQMDKATGCSTETAILDCHQMWKYDDFVFEKIGEGFFGTVFKVIHKTTDQVLVLKELKRSSDEYHKTMFIEEIKTLGRLCHPNVLKCEGFAIHDGNICLVTEYIDGGSLEELLVKRSSLLICWETRLAVAMEIALGMAYLHSAGVIHRDLASKNILIRTKPNGRLQAIVADLGLSHTVTGQITSEEEYDLEVVGSPYHMAPEVLCHKPYNMKADIFSYGIILCEMITMCPGADPDDVPRTNDFGLAVEDFSEMASDCPSKLLDLTVRCCQVNPKERPKFNNIVKTLDIILDKLVDSDDEILNDNHSADIKPDYIIENSLLCTCQHDHDFDINEDHLGIQDSKDRFGSVRKTASRRLLKRHLPRCHSCGGRIWKSPQTNNPKAILAKNQCNLPYEKTDNCTITLKQKQSSDAKDDFVAVNLLNDSHETFTAKLNELAENTPGKLPRFFQNILRSRFAKIRPKDVKRRWRKSLHDIFSSQHNQHLGPINKGETDLPNEEISKKPEEFYDDCKCTIQNKSEKRRKSSKTRRKSGQSSDMQVEKAISTSKGEHYNQLCVDLDTSVESCSHDDAVSPCLSANPNGQSFAHALAVSVDSLDKLGLSEASRECNGRSRRYSMPSRKARHNRVQSNDPSHPPLTRQSSGSSKILNFLRRKAHSSPRD